MSPAEAFTALEALDGGVDCARLIEHCFAGELGPVRLYIRSGGDVSCNQPMVDRNTPLIAAAAGGQAEVARLLVEAGAELEFEEEETGMTALCVAAREGHLETLKVLLDAGADKLHSDLASAAPLHAAAAQGRLEVVKELIARGVPVDLPSEKKDDNLGGITPLIYAALGGHSEVARYLVEQAGADPKHIANNGSSATMAALHLKNLELAKYLHSKGSPALAFYNGNMSTLGFAAQIGYSEGMDWLIHEAGVDVNVRNKRDQSTALLISVRNGYLQATKLLLEWGADASLRDIDGKTALDYAREAENQIQIDLLEGREVVIPEVPAESSEQQGDVG